MADEAKGLIQMILQRISKTQFPPLCNSSPAPTQTNPSQHWILSLWVGYRLREMPYSELCPFHFPAIKSRLTLSKAGKWDNKTHHFTPQNTYANIFQCPLHQERKEKKRKFLWKGRSISVEPGKSFTSTWLFMLIWILDAVFDLFLDDIGLWLSAMKSACKGLVQSPLQVVQRERELSC